MRFHSNFTLKFLSTELWQLSFHTKLFLYLNCKIKSNNESLMIKSTQYFYVHSVRHWYGCLKALFFKNFHFEFCCLFVRWNSSLFVIVLTPIFSLCHFFFCWVSLSRSSYTFQDDGILLQSSWWTGDLKKLRWRYFELMFGLMLSNHTLLFVLHKTFLFILNWWYYSSCCN